jgi:hypothetical protein
MDCFGVQSEDTVRRCTKYYLLAGPACLWCLLIIVHPIKVLLFCGVGFGIPSWLFLSLMFMGGAFGIRQIYLSSKVGRFVLFCFLMWRSPKPWLFMPHSWYFWKSFPWVVRTHPLVFETLWSSSVEVMDYLIILSMKNK